MFAGEDKRHGTHRLNRLELLVQDLENQFLPTGAEHTLPSSSTGTIQGDLGVLSRSNLPLDAHDVIRLQDVQRAPLDFRALERAIRIRTFIINGRLGGAFRSPLALLYDLEAQEELDEVARD